MSTVFDYTSLKITTMDKEVLFALVKREGTKEMMMSPKFEAYKNAALEAINGVSIEYIHECINDIRGEDAIGEAFYDVVFEFYVKELIDMDRFIAIMKPITKLNIASSQIEYKRLYSISRFPRTYEEDGLKSFELLIHMGCLPKEPRDLIKNIIKQGVHNSYITLFKKNYGVLVDECNDELIKEFKNRYSFDADFE